MQIGVFLNKFLKHVFNIISKSNNHPWKKVCEKNDAQIGRVAVVKKDPGPWKKIFEKKSCQLICTDKTYKTMSGNFFKINGSRDI